MQRRPCWLLALVLSMPAFAQHLVEAPEPNDIFGLPTPLGCGARASGMLAPGDVDYYAVVVAMPGHIKAYTSSGMLGGPVVDTIVEIHDAADVVLAGDDDSGTSLWSYAGCNVVVPGLYYVVVMGFAPLTAGPYTLDLICQPEPVVLEGPEPNGDPLLGEFPTPTGCGTVNVGFIAPGEDDWWVLMLPAPTTLNITTGPGGAGLALEDTVVELKDVFGVPLAFDDDGGEALYSSISSPVLPAGFYFVDVAAFAAAAFGSYSIRIGCGEPASVVADVTIPAGFPGCPGTAGIPTITRRGATPAPAAIRVRPRIGTTFNVDVSLVPPGAPLFRILGFVAIPGLFPLPGAPGCFGHVTADSVALAFADAVGFHAFDLYIPNLMPLVGLPLNWQVAVLDPPANPLGITTSNIAASLIGNIGFP